MSTYNSEPSEANTVDEFIKCTNNSLSYDEISLYNKDADYGLNSISYNLVNDYIPLMLEKSLVVTLNDTEYNKYKYRPKLLAHDIYGNSELYYIILLLNNVCSVKEFDFKQVNMLKIDDIESILSSIYNSECNTINENRAKCGM